MRKEKRKKEKRKKEKREKHKSQNSYIPHPLLLSRRFIGFLNLLLKRVLERGSGAHSLGW